MLEKKNVSTEYRKGNVTWVHKVFCERREFSVTIMNQASSNQII